MQYTMLPEPATGEKCGSGEHQLSDHRTIYLDRISCSACRLKYGLLYDYEWSVRDIARLVSDYEASKQCLCGGPNCGANAKNWYSIKYPYFASRFA